VSLLSPIGLKCCVVYLLALKYLIITTEVYKNGNS